MLAPRSASKLLDKRSRLARAYPKRDRPEGAKASSSQGASYRAYPSSPSSPPAPAPSEATRATVRPPPPLRPGASAPGRGRSGQSLCARGCTAAAPVLAHAGCVLRRCARHAPARATKPEADTPSPQPPRHGRRHAVVCQAAYDRCSNRGTSAAEGGRSASLGGHAASRSAAAQWSRRGAPRGRVRAARRPPEAARRRAASLRGGAGLAAGARGHRLQASKARGAAPGPGRGRRPPDPPHAGRRPAPARGPAPWTPAEARVRARLGQVRLAAQAGGGPEKRKITPGRASATARRRQR